MGGIGSGRQESIDRKTNVEDCLSINAGNVGIREILNANALCAEGNGRLRWTDRYDDSELASVGYRIVKDYDDLFLTLKYNANQSSNQIQINDEISLLSSPTPFGVRWWFSCPGCHKRTFKLYLPLSSVYFRCRTCHNLTYSSSRESHKYDRLIRVIAKMANLDQVKVRESIARRWLK